MYPLVKKKEHGSDEPPGDGESPRQPQPMQSEPVSGEATVPHRKQGRRGSLGAIFSSAKRTLSPNPRRKGKTQFQPPPNFATVLEHKILQGPLPESATIPEKTAPPRTSSGSKLVKRLTNIGPKHSGKKSSSSVASESTTKSSSPHPSSGGKRLVRRIKKPASQQQSHHPRPPPTDQSPTDQSQQQGAKPGKRKIIRKKIEKQHPTSSSTGNQLPGKKEILRARPSPSPVRNHTLQREASEGSRRAERQSLSQLKGIVMTDHDEKLLREAVSRHSRDKELQHEMNEMAVKHAEDMYWLRLELDTMRKSKEAVEDRIAELYRDVQDIIQKDQEQKLHTLEVKRKKENNENICDDNIPAEKDEDSSMMMIEPEYVASLQSQIEKYEKMLKVMQHQNALVKHSTENVVTSLKDEISDLMDEKTRMEVNLMNKMTDIDREKRLLAEELAHLKQKSKIEEDNKKEKQQLEYDLKLAQAENNRLRQQLLKSKFDDDDISETSRSDNMDMQNQQREQLQLLVSTNKSLTDHLHQAKENAKSISAKWAEEKETMTSEINQLKNELVALRSLDGNTDNIQILQQERDNSVAALDRVKVLWDRADEEIKNLEGVIVEVIAVKSESNNNKESLGSTAATNTTAESSHDDLQPHSNHDITPTDIDRVLSLLETASLVHGQVKTSLTLIELRLRNNLDSLQHNRVEGKVNNENGTFAEQQQAILREAMSAIREVQEKVEGQIEQLRKKSQAETEHVKEAMATKVTELKKMMAKQARLEEEIARLNQTNGESTEIKDESMDESQEKQAEASSLELYVSQRALETLQNEVLIVVSRIKEQNEQIARLTSEVEEHRIRERTLMAELRRHINDQLSRQLQDQDRIMASPTFEESIGSGYNVQEETEQLPQYYNRDGVEYPESDNEFEEESSYEEIIEEEEEVIIEEYEEETFHEDHTAYEYDEQTVYEEVLPKKEPKLVLPRAATANGRGNHDDDDVEVEFVTTYDEETVCDDHVIFGDNATVC